MPRSAKPLLRLVALGAGIVLGVGACNGSGPEKPDDPPAPEALPRETFEPGTPPAALRGAVQRGLATPGKQDTFHFVIIRDGDRHGPTYSEGRFHVLVGAGVEYPAGTLHVHHAWNQSGDVDGVNEILQVRGLSVAVERGAQAPYDAAVGEAVAAFCEALASQTTLHPDCIVAMGEVPGAREYPRDSLERELAERARRGVPLPPTDRELRIQSAGGAFVALQVETRVTEASRNVGMMMRKSFGDENRGMLFVYPNLDYRWFWMANCRVPMDLAYVREGRIDEIYTMVPEPGVPGPEKTRYSSRAAVRYVLEAPSGWFRRNRVERGSKVSGLPQK